MTIELVELGVPAVVIVALDPVPVELEAAPRSRVPPLGPPGGAILMFVFAARVVNASRVLP